MMINPDDDKKEAIPDFRNGFFFVRYLLQIGITSRYKIEWV